MVIHVVLYRPKPNLEKTLRAAFTDAMSAARDEIPQIRRFIVGKRTLDGPQYQMGNFPDLPYVAIVEFSNREGLDAYLAHPGHQQLGRLFNTTAEAALIYDFDAVDAAAAASLVDD